MPRIWALSAAMFVLSLGCKCNGPSGALGDVLGSYCKFIDRCPGQLQFNIAYRNQAECVDILNWAATCRIGSVEGPNGESTLTVQQQTLNIDPAAAAACKAFLDNATCDTALSCDSDTDAGCNPCSRLLNPPSPMGTGGGSGAGLDQPCRQESDCARGFYCLGSQPTADGGETCQVCKPLRGVGGNCVDPPRVGCGPNLFCDVASGTCVFLQMAGSACTSAAQCASGFCNSSKRCDSGGQTGATCSVDGDCREGFCDSSRRCSLSRANGEPCTSADQCRNRICDVGTQKCGKPDGAACSSASECQGACIGAVCGRGVALGGACTNGGACQSGFCHPQGMVCAQPCSSGCGATQFCDRYGACRDALPAGSTCQGDDDCASHFCNSSDVCATRAAVGQPCGSPRDCAVGSLCRGGTCVAYAKPGEACTSIDSCAPPFLCTKGKCELMSLSCQPAKTGQQCTALSVCDADNFCDVTADITCARKKQAGESCARSVECVSGLFCNRSSRQCQPLLRAGEVCDRNRPCTSNLFCDSTVSPNVCSMLKSPGGSCSEDSDCLSGSCTNTGGSGQVCASPCVPVPPGEQPACRAARCSDFGYNCGVIDAGCGEAVSCGQCSMPYQSCGGGGQPGVCGCTPIRACSAVMCGGSVDNGCGQTLPCNATCDGGATCGAAVSGICGCRTDHQQGPLLGSVAVSLPGPTGTNLVAWDHLDKIAATDDAGVRVPFRGIAYSEVLLVTGFGFNLPPTASINGVQFEIRARNASASTTNLLDRVMLYPAGVPAQTSLSGGSLTSQWRAQRVGGDGSLWGTGPLPADVNVSSFGVGISARGFDPSEVYIDSVAATVFYAHRCDCRYTCRSDSECGSDGCGGFCGGGSGSCPDAGVCSAGYCRPPVFVDSTTGLMWTNEGFDVADCRSVSLGGFTDWRVPTIDELRTRVLGCPATAPSGSCPVSSQCTDPALCLDAGCGGCAPNAGPHPSGCYLDKHLTWCSGAGPHFSSTLGGAAPYTLDFSTGRIALGAGATRYRCVRP